MTLSKDLVDDDRDVRFYIHTYIRAFNDDFEKGLTG